MKGWTCNFSATFSQSILERQYIIPHSSKCFSLMKLSMSSTHFFVLGNTEYLWDSECTGCEIQKGWSFQLSATRISIKELPQIWAIETLPKNNAVNKTKSLHYIFFDTSCGSCSQSQNWCSGKLLFQDTKTLDKEQQAIKLRIWTLT